MNINFITLYGVVAEMVTDATGLLTFMRDQKEEQTPVPHPQLA
jgi:hypothetical protein